MDAQDPFDAHGRAVLRALLKGRVTPLLGAGANQCGRPPQSRWDPRGVYLPTSDELARYLAAAFDYPPDERLDLARVAQHVAVDEGLGPLYDELRELFAYHGAEPSPLHRFFAAVPELLRARGRPYQLILTTNYDDSLERAFAEANEPFDVVWYAADGRERGKFWHSRHDAANAVLIEDPNSYANLSLDECTVILKLHGTIDRSDRERDSFVITEDHYTDYLTRTDIDSLVPVKLSERLAWSHFLLLGHSMRDWNLRVILYRIWGEQKLNFKSWSIQLDPSPLERRFWENRGDVEIIDLPLDRYIAALDDCLHSAAFADVVA